MKSVMWYIWKRKTLFGFVVNLIIFFILVALYNLYNIPSNDPLSLFARALEDLSSKLPKKYPFIYLAITFIISSSITLSLGWVVRYYLLPGNKSVLLNALIDRCSEITKLGCKQVEKDIEKVSEWVDGLRTGCSITPEDCIVLGKEVIEVTSARKLYATCLQTPQDLHDNLRGFSEIIAAEINRTGKKLIRIIICTPIIFDLSSKSARDQEKIKWLVSLHKNGLSLRYIEKPRFLNIAQINGVRKNKLDIMLFDKKVVYSLENDDKRLTTLYVNGHYTLAIIDSPSDVKMYEKFMQNLISASKDVIEHIQEMGWVTQYS